MYNEFISFIGELSFSYGKDINLMVYSKIFQSVFNIDIIRSGVEWLDVIL